MTYGLDPKQFVLRIIRPVLQRSLGLWSPSAEVIVFGTALVESELRYVAQVGGPALGPFQMEPATHHDLYVNFLEYQRELRGKVIRLSSHLGPGDPDPEEMIGNWFYSTAMCRVHYRRVKAALPPTHDAAAMAEYWKRWYNTRLGRGTVEKALPHFKFAIDRSGSV